MAKTRTFKVVNGRMFFKCPTCQAKRMVAVYSRLRRRSIRCQKCGELTNCVFNRRVDTREQQMGKVIMVTADGRKLNVELRDKSRYGFGILASFRDANRLRISQQVTFQCNWNPKLLGNSRYEIKSVRVQRIGVQRIS